MCEQMESWDRQNPFEIIASLKAYGENRCTFVISTWPMDRIYRWVLPSAFLPSAGTNDDYTGSHTYVRDYKVKFRKQP